VVTVHLVDYDHLCHVDDPENHLYQLHVLLLDDLARVVGYYQNQNVIDEVHEDYYDSHHLLLDLHDHIDRLHLFLLVHLDDYHHQIHDHLVEDHVDHGHDLLDLVVNVNDLCLKN
jgi:hypothetical protein